MSRLDQIINHVSTRNPIHTRKLRKNLTSLDDTYRQRAEEFLERYEKLLAAEGHNLDYATDCYLKMLADITIETIHFHRTGEYTSKSFAEVNRRVYNNPDVMAYYLHALLLSQFLWKHHYEMFCFFIEQLGRRKTTIKHYLEIGGGHGLQVAEAAKTLNPDATLTVVDISPTSLDISRRLVKNPRVEFILQDIFAYQPAHQFDFITLGEVLEHMEDPAALLRCVRELLADGGTLFITTPANAPTIDHIHLFRDAAEIRQLLHDAGLEIITEFSRYAEEVDEATAAKYKVTLHYGACTKKSQASP